MIQSTKGLKGHPVKATDGNIGKVEDFLFDDREWGLRYLVIDTGGWLSSRKVLVTPRHLVPPDSGIYAENFPVALTRQQVEESPPLEHDAPVSRQFEEEFARYFGDQPYWAGLEMTAGVMPAPIIHTADVLEERGRRIEKIEESHLRSANEVTGYRISAKNGEFGHISDLIIDTEKWKVIYLVADIGGWLSGRSVMLQLDWIESFDWTLGTAEVGLTTEQIELSPVFDPEVPINRNYLRELCDYYGRPYDT